MRGASKFHLGQRVVGSDVKRSLKGRPGIVVKKGPVNHYKVKFDDGKEEWAFSLWLDKE